MATPTSIDLRSVPTRLFRYPLPPIRYHPLSVPLPPLYVVDFFYELSCQQLINISIRKLSHFRYVSEELLEPDNTCVTRRPLILYEERFGAASTRAAAANPPRRFTRYNRQKVRILFKKFILPYLPQHLTRIPISRHVIYELVLTSDS